MLVSAQRKLRRELEAVGRQLQHQTGRADEQREARMRLELENKELRRLKMVVRRERELMFT